MSGKTEGFAGRRLCGCLLLLAGLLTQAGCGSLPRNTERPASYAYTDTDGTGLGRARRAEIRRHPGESGFMLLVDGLDAFLARGQLAAQAERSIDAQYYLLHKDLTGALFVHQLVEAADRGVRVRLLVDDMALGGRELGAAVLDSHPGIEVRLFNPFYRGTNRSLQLLSRFGSVTRRMHNKSFTVDNQASIIGGRNIGDEYFGADPDLDFSDADVLLIGPVVKEISASFDDYWNSELAYPATTLLGREPTSREIREGRQALDDLLTEQAIADYRRALSDSELADRIRNDRVQFEWGGAHLVHDDPEKLLADGSNPAYHLAPQLEPYFNGVRDELYIFSPYFVPGDPGTVFLSELSKKGVRVRVVTNSLSSTDVALVHSGYAKYRKDLLRAGVELYEMKAKPRATKRPGRFRLSGSSKASLHSKAFIFDRKEIFIGSLNLDPRSIHENTEIGVVLSSPGSASRLASEVDEVLEQVTYRLKLETHENGVEQIGWYEREDASEPSYRVDPQTGFWQRLGIGLIGLLPIESQL